MPKNGKNANSPVTPADRGDSLPEAPLDIAEATWADDLAGGVPQVSGQLPLVGLGGSAGSIGAIQKFLKAEDELRRSEGLYRAIGESIDYGVWVCAPDGRNTYASESFLRLVGLTQEQCSNFGWGEVLHPEDRERTIQAWQECVRTGDIWDIEHRFRGVDGKWHDLLARGVPVKDDRGHIICWAGINLDISGRKVADEALRRSEARFRAAVATVSSLLWTNNAQGKMEGEQPGWGNFTGQTEAEYQGYGWSLAVHPDDAEPTIDAWERAVAEKRLFEFEHRVRRHDGEWRLCSIRAVPLLGADGEVLEWVGVHTDITERRRDEESLHHANRRLETVLGSVTDGLAVLDRNWRYTYFSEQAARIIGMDAVDLLGGCVWELFPATEGTKFHEGYHRAVATGQKVEFEEYYPEPINKWLECHCYPSDEGLSVYFHDVTARKQAEETLRQNEALFSTLLEQAPLGVYVVDAQFRLQQVNSLAQPVFGDYRALLGRDFTEVMTVVWGPVVGPDVARIFRHTLETGERYISPPFVHPRADLGVEQAYDWETQRVTLPDGRHGVVCYFIDVTERRRVETALLEAKQAAETANQSKDRFLAVLSHELRTPLNPVLMTVSALEHDPDLRPDIREDLIMIKRNVELETKLIDDLLDLSRIRSGKVELKSEAVDLNEAVRQACGICRPQLVEQNVRLQTHLDDGVCHIAADPARLQQILWNVLKNAVKFTPEEGVVHVSTARLGPDRCEVRIRDRGIGIPADVLPRIFNAFEQGDAHITRQFGGLGLGLAISRALVELHGGSIRAESEGQGQGATFIIELPGQSALPANAISISTPGDETATAIRILLVEDHADTAHTLARLLRKARFQVVVTADVASATAAAENERFDVLISDLGLPDGTGYEVMRAVRARRIIPGIAMSGYGMEEDMQKSREAGFTEHLVKPIDLPQLIASIRRATESRG